MIIKKYLPLTGIIGLGALTTLANQLPTSNDNPTYAPSNVQAQLRLNIRENADTVHFIRDNNDPKILTKTYILKHADPYSMRPYIREMVQAQRVDYNNAAGRANPDYYNTYSKDNEAKTAKIFVPTGVECIKYVDGTGALIVSAEAYRFASNENGMGIDELIATLDVPNLANSSGQPKYIYFPANRPAAELQKMIKLVGANMSNDTVELIGGKDKVEVDNDLNCLFFNTALYSRKNIEEMLQLYDVAHPVVKVSVTVYELTEEDDGTLGMDFRAWKNNDGIKLFSAGANFSKNHNLADMTQIVPPSGTINNHYFNFQPKWNTKYLDFLVSKGKAKIVSTGDLSIQNGSTGAMERKSGIMYAKLTPIEPTVSPAGDKIEHGNEVDVTVENSKFKFNLAVTPSITVNATMLNLNVSTTSLLGYTSTGALRVSNYSNQQKVMLNNGRNRIYLGGIEKTQVVRDSGGVPFLKDIPGLGWLFSTERESSKKSQVIVVADCELQYTSSAINPADLEQIEVITKATSQAGSSNSYGYRQYLLDSER